MPEILGIGTDIEEPRRFLKHFTEAGEPDELIREIFTKEEIRLNAAHTMALNCFTAGFCCKEAIFKALGKSWMNGPIGWQDMELLFSNPDSMDKYGIRLAHRARAMMEELGGSKITGKLKVGNDHIIFNVYIAP